MRRVIQMFWNKWRKDDYEPDQSEEIAGIKARITRMETEILDIMQSQQLIRDKIMRKIRLKTQETEEEEGTWAGIPKAKDINSKSF